MIMMGRLEKRSVCLVIFGYRQKTLGAPEIAELFSLWYLGLRIAVRLRGGPWAR